MGLTFWLALPVLLAGLGLAVYGCSVLATGRLSEKARAAFRTTRDAGMYPLCSGVALAFLALGQIFPGILVGLIATIAALAFMGLAFLRYRPRPKTLS